MDVVDEALKRHDAQLLAYNLNASTTFRLSLTASGCQCVQSADSKEERFQVQFRKTLCDLLRHSTVSAGVDPVSVTTFSAHTLFFCAHTLNI